MSNVRPNVQLSFVVTDVDTIESEGNQLQAVVVTLSPNPPTSVQSTVLSGEFTGDIVLTIQGPAPLLRSYAERIEEDQLFQGMLTGLPRIDPTSLSTEEIEALSEHDGVLEALSAPAEA